MMYDGLLFVCFGCLLVALWLLRLCCSFGQVNLVMLFDCSIAFVLLVVSCCVYCDVVMP